jgi:hypothetical protein
VVHPNSGHHFPSQFVFDSSLDSLPPQLSHPLDYAMK